MHYYLMNLPRVLPNHAVAFRQRQAKGRGVKGVGPERQGQTRHGTTREQGAENEVPESGFNARFHSLRERLPHSRKEARSRGSVWGTRSQD